MIYLLVIGLVSILGQAVLLRELSVAFYGIELIYVLALGIWLAWTALGALIGRRNLTPAIHWMQFLFLLFALLLPADVVFIRSIRTLFSEVRGAFLPFTSQVLAMAAALLPIGLLSGLIFQWGAKLYISREQTFARAYAIESAGGLAGGLCATLFLRFGLQNLTIALLCALFSLGAVWAGRHEKSRWVRLTAAAAIALMIAACWYAAALDRAMTAWTHPSLLASRDTPYCRITVTKQESQIAVYENDALSFETEGTDAEEFVHLAALLHPHPAHVLILGGGIEGMVMETLKHAPAQVDYVELNPAMLSLVVPFLPREMQEPLQAAPVRVTVGDARRFLDQAGHFDLILIGMPEPASGQANRFYTLEFFAQCAAHLNPDGILAFRLKTAENLWTTQQAGRAISIYRALKAALPEVLVLPGGTNIFAASRLPLAEDPLILSSRLEARAITTRLVSAPYIRYLYTNDRFSKIARTLGSASAPVNTDTHPICYEYTLMIWLSKFYPSLAAIDMSALSSWNSFHNGWVWIAALAVPLLFIFSRRLTSLRRALLVAVAAFMGMALETALVLYYQVKSGILYQDIGVLLTGFMAGLALGALVTDRWIPRRTRSIPHRYGFLLCIGFCIFSLATGAWMNSGTMRGLAEITGLLLIAGFLVAAVLAYVSSGSTHDQRDLVAPLYAADLIGGCAASLISTLLLIPVAGMAITAASMAPLALLSILLLKWKGGTDD
jgi:spermidine synthase